LEYTNTSMASRYVFAFNPIAIITVPRTAACICSPGSIVPPCHHHNHPGAQTLKSLIKRPQFARTALHLNYFPIDLARGIGWNLFMRASADLLTKTKAHNSGQPTFGSVCSVGQSSRVNFSNQARPVEVPKSQLKTLETPANVPSPEPHWSYFVVVAFIKKR